jgi:septal ring-binding cell division protein DamX
MEEEPMSQQEIQGYPSHRVIFDFILGQKTGTLLFQPFGRKLYFDNGNLIFANSEKPEEHFSEILVDMGVLTEDDLSQVRAGLERGESLGKKLRELDMASSQQLAAALKQQITGIVEAVLEDPDARSEVQEGQLPQKLPKLKIQTLALALQSLMNLETGSLFSMLPVDASIAKTDSFNEARGKLDFPDAYQEFLNFIGHRSMTDAEQLSRDFRWARDMTDRVIYALVMLGMVRYVPDSELPAAGDDGIPGEISTLPSDNTIGTDLLADVLPEEEGGATTSQLTLDDLAAEDDDTDGETSIGYDTLPPQKVDELTEDASTQPAFPAVGGDFSDDTDTQPLVVAGETEEVDLPNLDDTAVDGLDFNASNLEPASDLDEPETLPGFAGIEEESDTVPGQKIDLPSFDDLNEEEETGEVTEPDLEVDAGDDDTNSFFSKVYASESDTEPMQTVGDDDEDPFADLQAEATSFGNVQAEESLKEEPATLSADDFEPLPDEEESDTLAGGDTLTDTATWADAPDPTADTQPHPTIDPDTQDTLPPQQVVLPDEDEPEEETAATEEPKKKSRLPLLAAVALLFVVFAAAAAYFTGMLPFGGDAYDMGGDQVAAVPADPEPTPTDPTGTYVPEGTDSDTNDQTGAEPADSMTEAEPTAGEGLADAGDEPATPTTGRDDGRPVTEEPDASPSASGTQGSGGGDTAEDVITSPEPARSEPPADRSQPSEPVSDTPRAQPQRFTSSSGSDAAGAVAARTGAASFSRVEVDGMTRDSTSFLVNQSGNFALAFIVACEIQTVNNILDRDFPGEILVFPRIINGRRCYMMTWGLFDDTASASAAKSQMPSALFNASDPPWTVDLRKYR